MTRDEAAELAEGEILEYRVGGVWRVGQVYRPLEGRGTVAMAPTIHRSSVVAEVAPIDLRR